LFNYLVDFAVPPVLVETTENQLLVVCDPVFEDTVLEQPDFPELLTRRFRTQIYLVAGQVLVQSLVVLVQNWQN
jgi:hypothetical protein